MCTCVISKLEWLFTGFLTQYVLCVCKSFTIILNMWNMYICYACLFDCILICDYVFNCAPWCLCFGVRELTNSLPAELLCFSPPPPLILYSTLVRFCMLTRWWPHHQSTVSFSRGHQDTEDEMKLCIILPHFLLLRHLSLYASTLWHLTLSQHLTELVSLTSYNVLWIARTRWTPNDRSKLAGSERQEGYSLLNSKETVKR